MYNQKLIAGRYYWGREPDAARPLSDHYLHCNFKLINTGTLVLSGKFEYCNFSFTDLQNAVVSGEFTGCNFSGVNFWDATFRGPRFKGCKFNGANFTSAVGLFTCRLDDQCSAINTTKAYIVWHPERKYYYFQADKPVPLLPAAPLQPSYSPPNSKKSMDLYDVDEEGESRPNPYDDYNEGMWSEWGWASTPTAPRNVPAVLICSDESELVIA